MLVHPTGAAARGVRAGDFVRVFSDRGVLEAHAELSLDVMPGLVLANVGRWASLNQGGTSVNVLSADRHSSLGQAETYSDNLVEVAAV